MNPGRPERCRDTSRRQSRRVPNAQGLGPRRTVSPPCWPPPFSAPRIASASPFDRGALTTNYPVALGQTFLF